MKKNYYYTLFAIAIVSMISSCTIQKRSHMKGYHVTWKNQKVENTTANVKISSPEQELASTEEVAETMEMLETTTSAPSVSISEDKNEVAVVETTVVSEKKTKAKKSPIKETKIEIKEAIKNLIPSNVASKNLAQKNSKENKLPLDTNSPLGTNALLLVIITILIPPLGVAIYEGLTSRFWISLILTILGFLPGLIYSLLVVTGTI